MTNGPKSADSRHEFCVVVPGFTHQILVMQMARSRGIKAAIPGRSRRKVMLSGTRAEVEAVLREASKLVLIHDLNVLKALERLLLDHQLGVPARLVTALIMADFKVALALGNLQKKPAPLPHGAGNRASDSFGPSQVQRN